LTIFLLIYYVGKVGKVDDYKTFLELRRIVSFSLQAVVYFWLV